jgi:hypothetical protein
MSMTQVQVYRLAGAPLRQSAPIGLPVIITPLVPPGSGGLAGRVQILSSSLIVCLWLHLFRAAVQAVLTGPGPGQQFAQIVSCGRHRARSTCTGSGW